MHIDAKINNFDVLVQFSSTKCALHPKVRERLRERILEPKCTPPINLDSHVDPTHLTLDTSTKEGAASAKERVEPTNAYPTPTKDKTKAT